MSEENTELPNLDEMYVMSDDDFLKMEVPDDDEVNEEAEVVEEPNEEAEEESESTEEETEDENSEETTDDETETENEEEEEEPESTSEKAELEPESGEKKEDELNYKEEYEKVMAPFKANGIEMTLKTPEEVRQLMQMGANYNKKMVAMKPNLKFIKMLENNEILDEEKLGFLIDLNNKNPEAITKLLKDSGMNPLNIDVDVETDYTPKNYSVNDREVNFDSALEDIQATESGPKTVDIIATKWDQDSRDEIFKEPNILQAINDHVANGTYDKINNEVQRQRILGGFKGVSDLQAYMQTGTKLQAAMEDNSSKSANVVAPKKLVKLKDPKMIDRKKAASSPSSKVTKKSKGLTEDDIASMSDEDFEKHYAKNLASF